jgi:DNA-binding transcriptional ArsR family regulator
MTGVRSMQRRDGEALLDPAFVKAFSHPIRVEIVAEASLAPICVSEYRSRRHPELSRQAVEHHFSVLVECGAIEEVDVRHLRGGRAKYYAATARALFSEEDFLRLPPALRGSVTATLCSTLYERIQESLLGGTIDAHPERHLTWIPLELDWDGFLTVVTMLNAVFFSLRVVEAEAKERMDRAGAPPMHVTVAMMGFESPPPIRDHRVEMGSRLS